MKQPSPLIVTQEKNGFIGRFSVMASPCEILVDLTGGDKPPSLDRVNTMMWAVYTEARRIEQKFSRYVTSNLVYQINHAHLVF